MLLKNFYPKLGNLTKKNNVKWRLTREGKIRCTLNSRVCCPITAVINMELGKRVNVSDAIDYAGDIQIDDFSANTIMKAADFPSRELHRYEQDARAALMRATNLS